VEDDLAACKRQSLRCVHARRTGGRGADPETPRRAALAQRRERPAQPARPRSAGRCSPSVAPRQGGCGHGTSIGARRSVCRPRSESFGDGGDPVPKNPGQLRVPWGLRGFAKPHSCAVERVGLLIVVQAVAGSSPVAHLIATTPGRLHHYSSLEGPAAAGPRRSRSGVASVGRITTPRPARTRQAVQSRKAGPRASP
jgi:hypothetical protein